MTKLYWLRRDISDPDTAPPGSYWLVYDNDHPLAMPLAMVPDTKHNCESVLRKLSNAL